MRSDYIKKSKICISSQFACDGHKQCEHGEDEEFTLCKERNAFPEGSGFKCNETGTDLEILALRCNGKIECKDGSDETNCDINIEYLFIILTLGLCIITITSGILRCCCDTKRVIRVIQSEKFPNQAIKNIFI